MSTKELGNEAFKNKNYPQAVAYFTQAIAEAPGDHTIYGNRSAAYYNMHNFNEALADGDKCIQLKPDWGRGYQRKA